MDLPFTKFRDVKTDKICEIKFKLDLGSKVYVYFVCANGGQPRGDSKWLGRFEVTEGIGNREIPDLANIRILDSWDRRTPTQKEILRLIERAESMGRDGHWLDILMPIEPMMEQKQRLRAFLGETWERHLSSGGLD